MKVFIVTQKSPNTKLVLGTTQTLQEASQIALKQVTLLLGRMASTCLVRHNKPSVWLIDDINILSDGTMVSKGQFDLEIHEVEL